jgi:DnaJ-class molecular chaperone
VKAHSQGGLLFSPSAPCDRFFSWRGGHDHREHPCETCGATQVMRAVTKRYCAHPLPASRTASGIPAARQGEASRHGGPFGDLFSCRSGRAPPESTRRGDDVIADVPVLFVEAASGANHRGAHNGRIYDLGAPWKVPAAMSDGTCCASRDAGPSSQGTTIARGNLLARVKIVVPKTDEGAQRDVLEKLC